MYYRIKNIIDADILAEEITSKNQSMENVINRLHEVIQTLDDAYGTNRHSSAMGGYVLFFTDNASYRASIERILRHHNTEMENYEYSDVIATSNNFKWNEVLYLLSSDDSLVMIYPSEK